MKNRFWSNVLKKISGHDVIARWYWDDGGYVWMAVPDSQDILDGCFSENIDSPHTFDELQILKIDRDFKHGNLRFRHDIDLIYRDIKYTDNVEAKIVDNQLVITII
jgi:serine/threonine protein kinase